MISMPYNIHFILAPSYQWDEHTVKIRGIPNDLSLDHVKLLYESERETGETNGTKSMKRNSFGM